MTDLKLIDELLCYFKRPGETWADVERASAVTCEAVGRLREAWHAREMPVITLGLANYFDPLASSGGRAT